MAKYILILVVRSGNLVTSFQSFITRQRVLFASDSLFSATQKCTNSIFYNFDLRNLTEIYVLTEKAIPGPFKTLIKKRIVDIDVCYE